MPIRDVLPYLAGSPDAGVQAIQGTPLQADTATVAKGLGFPEGMIDRYGDVIGTRPRRKSDYLRDFALGMATNDPLASTKMATQVQQQYNQALDRQIKIAREQEQADREKANFLWEAIANARKFGGKHSKKMMVEGLKMGGVEPSQTMLDVMTDLDTVTESVFAKLREGNTSAAEVEAMITDPQVLGAQIRGVREAEAAGLAMKEATLRIDTAKQLQQKRSAEMGLPQGSTRERAIEVLQKKQTMPRDQWKEMVREKYPEFRGMGTDEIKDHATRHWDRPSRFEELNKFTGGRLARGGQIGTTTSGGAATDNWTTQMPVKVK